MLASDHGVIVFVGYKHSLRTEIKQVLLYTILKVQKLCAMDGADVSHKVRHGECTPGTTDSATKSAAAQIQMIIFLRKQGMQSNTSYISLRRLWKIGRGRQLRRYKQFE